MHRPTRESGPCKRPLIGYLLTDDRCAEALLTFQMGGYRTPVLSNRSQRVTAIKSPDSP